MFVCCYWQWQMESVHQVPCLRKGIEACLADFIIHRDERVRSGFRRTQQTAQVTRAWRRHVLREALFCILRKLCGAESFFFHLTPYRKIRPGTCFGVEGAPFHLLHTQRRAWLQSQDCGKMVSFCGLRIYMYIRPATSATYPPGRSGGCCYPRVAEDDASFAFHVCKI